MSHNITPSLTRLADVANGDNIPQYSVEIFTIRRGDAKSDGDVNISDALFIAQYLAGIREGGTTTSLTHLVNTASVKTDTDTGDKVTIADALLTAQMLADLRDENYNLI